MLSILNSYQLQLQQKYKISAPKQHQAFIALYLANQAIYAKWMNWMESERRECGRFFTFLKLIISSIYFTHYFIMLQGKQNRDSLMGRLMMVVLVYMDYWLPPLLFFTIPIWILPAIIYYAASKMLLMWRCFFKLGSKIISTNHPSDLAYAILRGNGRYLREQSQDVHKKQFYDYTSRRFMSIGEFDQTAKIIELQCESDLGLRFFAQSLKSGTVVGVQSNRSILKASNNSLGLIVATDYAVEGESVGYDCMLLFNFKSKMKGSGGAQLLKMLAYCRHQIEKEGHLVFGDYFEEGEVSTFISIFEGFRFRVIEQEDITKNIEYANKLATRKEMSWEGRLMEEVGNQIQRVLGRSKGVEGKQFIVLILQKIQ